MKKRFKFPSGLLLSAWLSLFGLTPHLDAIAVSENFRLCMSGYDMLCNQQLLTQQQQQQYQASRKQRNFNNCMSGYGMLCNQQLLTQQQQQQLAQKSTPSQSNQRLIGSQCAENGSCYGDISELTGRPKTVPVREYYRKDGTYVRGHYRSRPRR